MQDLHSILSNLVHSIHHLAQAIAVEDVVWIRLFNMLYRKHKNWMRQQGLPPTWDRDKASHDFQEGVFDALCFAPFPLWSDAAFSQFFFRESQC